MKTATKQLKKKTVKTEKKAVKPLSDFQGYRINRLGEKITFGCGSVKVNRKTLLQAAEAFEDKGFIAALEAAKKLSKEAHGQRNAFNIMQIKPEILRRIAGDIPKTIKK